MVVRFIIGVILLGSLTPPAAVAGPLCETQCESGRECRPYGGYCRNRQQGWYGGRREVKTGEDARSLLREYFVGTRRSVGELVERDTYFEAAVKNPRGMVVDRVIIDKRTGRIRSTY